MALEEGPYPVTKCPSVNQKFHAEFGVAKEEPDGPGLGLVILPGKHTPVVTSTPYGFPMGGVSLELESPLERGGFFHLWLKTPRISVSVTYPKLLSHASLLSHL